MIVSDLILSDPGFKHFLKSDTLICLKKQIYLFISFRDKTIGLFIVSHLLSKNKHSLVPVSPIRAIATFLCFM